MIRVQFKKDWQSRDGSASFKKDEITEFSESIAWDLAYLGIVKFKKTPNPEIEKAKQVFKLNKKKARP